MTKCASARRDWARSRIGFVRQSKQRKRGPPEQFEVGVDGRELEVMCDAHADAHHYTGDQAQSCQDEEVEINPTHVFPLFG